MQNQIRKKPIYGNCQVFSPEGELMFRCLEKKIKWYLDRNLAVLLHDNPLSIKLLFSPKGKGERQECLKVERANKCVVCGTEDINTLTKHHLVPFVYRQHFSDDRKKHSSLFVIPICRSCHYDYENNYAHKLKAYLGELYSAPINTVGKQKNNTSHKLIKSIIEKWNYIPKDRKEFLINKINQELKEYDIKLVLDLNKQETFESAEIKLREYFDNKPKGIEDMCHGKVVVQNIKNFDEFEKQWANHFIDSMKPQYLPKYFIETLCSSSL